MENNLVSVYIAAPVLAWLIAQVIKLIVSANKGKRDLSILMRSGSMPSSHTATTIALVTTLGVTEGITSPIFGVAAVFAAVVIYDALNVRRAVGEQGAVLKKLLSSAKDTTTFYRAKGHQPADVVIGAIIGFVCGLAMLQIL